MRSIDSAMPQSHFVQKLRGLLQLARISNSPTVVTNTLAGAALAGVVQSSGTVALLALALVMFYTAGMFLNDLCDLALDRVQRPERPLPSGVVTQREAWFATIALFGIGAALLWAVSAAAFISGLALIALIVLYDVWHKTNPLSPLIMALCRLFVYVTAFAAFSTQFTLQFALAGGALVLYLVGLTYIAKLENKGRVTGWWVVAALFAPALLLITGQPSALGGFVFGSFVTQVWHNIMLVYRQRQIGKAIGRLIAGIALVDALVLAMAGSIAGVIMALAAFALTLCLQRYIKGT